MGDVGWNEREELDIVTAGKNYGWPCYEADQHTPGYRDIPECGPIYATEGTANAAVGPVYRVLHGAGPDDANAILGGPVYQGTGYPSPFVGRAFVADAVHGWIRHVNPTAAPPLTATPFATGWDGVGLETAPNGDLVTVDMFNGQIRRIAYAPGNRVPVPEVTINPTGGPAPLAVHFSSAGTTDPDGDSLTYAWTWGDGLPGGSGPEADHTYLTGGNKTARLTVTDARGASAFKDVTVFVGNSPPVVTIDSPADGATYKTGDDDHPDRARQRRGGRRADRRLTRMGHPADPRHPPAPRRDRRRDPDEPRHRHRPRRRRPLRDQPDGHRQRRPGGDQDHHDQPADRVAGPSLGA